MGERELEARTGFEPVHDDFADRSLSHLGTAPLTFSYAVQVEAVSSDEVRVEQSTRR